MSSALSPDTTPSLSPPSPPSPPPPNTNSTTLPPPSISPPSPTTPSISSTPLPQPSPSAPNPTGSATRSPPSPSGGGGGGGLFSTSPSSSSSSSSEGIPAGVLVGIAIGGVVVLVLVTLICLLCKKKPKIEEDESAYYTSPPPPPPLGPKAFSKNTFTYEELARATNGFSDANLVGQGGFCYVHKGTLPNGKEVAVKQLKTGNGQGEKEFKTEVEIITRVHHKHLVSLVGYCIADSLKRLLVYEFVPNNNLEFHLHGKGRPTMEWITRLKIAIGSAKGLSYLHEDCNPKIIHRDIKAKNILLDFKFEAKVADFGLAKVSFDTNTHVSTRVMGTFGYMAPEYAASGKLTDKSDVFSFGVVLLELITGRKPVDSNNAYEDDNLVDWARPLLNRASEEGDFDGLADKKLNKKYGKEEMARMVACAAACVRHSARRRPRMSQIVRALEGNVSLSDLNEGMRPGHSNVHSSQGGSTDFDTNRYREDMNKFRTMATQEYNASGEYSSSKSNK
ncbi:unnamed protein product [Cochlearia groenlandica]